MRKFFRSNPASPKTPDVKSDTSPIANGQQKAEKKKEKAAPLVVTSKAANIVNQSFLLNAPQLARPGDAETLAEALAAEVVADNVDAGIPVLLTTVPTQIDLSNAPPNLRRGSVLKIHGREPSISSENGQQSPTTSDQANHLSVASPPLSPLVGRSNSVTSGGSRPRVHFDVSEKIILEAQTYTHQQRFTISSGSFLHFDRPPTTHYKFQTTTESIHTKGTLLQLVTSASDEDGKNTWDSVTPLPLYAARYHNPAFTSTERTIYWEADLRSLGFSKFSSLDHADKSVSSTTIRGNSSEVNGSVQLDDPENLNLMRSVSHDIPTLSNRMTGSAIGVGFIVKSVTPDTVPFLRRRSSLRPVDEFTFPTSVLGDGIFWSSDNGGTIFVGNKHTRHTVKAGLGDSIGIGITFKLDPSKISVPKEEALTPPITPPPVGPRKDSKEGFRRKSSTGSQSDEPCSDPSELKKVPIEIFFVVNGEKKLSLHHPDTATDPFDIPIPDYMLGEYDIFPCICVQGAGVECKTRLGEAVQWQGAGGASEVRARNQGKSGQSGAAASKSSKWWSHIGSH